MKKHLGNILLEKGYISSQDLDRALAYQTRKILGDNFRDSWSTDYLLEVARTKYNNRDQFYLGRILTEMKLLPETAVLEALEIQRLSPSEAPRGRLDALNRIITRMNSSYSLIDLLHQVLVLAAQLVEAESASLIIHDHARDSLVILMPTGPGAEAVRDQEIPKDRGIVGWVYRTGTSVISNDTAGDSRFYAAIDAASGYSSRQILCVPLTVKDKKLGAIEALNKKASPAGSPGFSTADRFLLEMFSAQAAIAIENTRLAIALGQAEEDLSLRATEVAAAQRTHVAALIADSFLEEMRRSLVPLRGWAEKLGEVSSDARVEKYRAYIDREMARLLTHAEDVKTFLEDGFAPVPQREPAAEILRELESRVWVECRTMGIAFESRVDPAALALNVDRGLFLKVLEALFRNSREAMEDGGRFVVDARPADGRVQVTVEDTGRGIDAEPVETVFEPFYTRGKRHGAGLGLTMARRIVELHGGTIKVANLPAAADERAGGARFTITLPPA
jgi:signal transduction histidine kinase